MKSVFADSYYFFALVNRNDAAHSKVKILSSAHEITIVTSAFILIELCDGLCKPHHRIVASELIRSLQEDLHVLIIPPTLALFEQGIELYANRPDKDWSLTDCLSFVVMNRYGITEALTGDRHFQ